MLYTKGYRLFVPSAASFGEALVVYHKISTHDGPALKAALSEPFDTAAHRAAMQWDERMRKSLD